MLLPARTPDAPVFSGMRISTTDVVERRRLVAGAPTQPRGNRGVSCAVRRNDVGSQPVSLRVFRVWGLGFMTLLLLPLHRLRQRGSHSEPVRQFQIRGEAGRIRLPEPPDPAKNRACRSLRFSRT